MYNLVDESIDLMPIGTVKVGNKSFLVTRLLRDNLFVEISEERKSLFAMSATFHREGWAI